LPEQLIDITILISNLISQIPLAVLVLLILYYRLKEDIRNLKLSIDALVNFSESLLYTLYLKGIMSDSEYKSLQTLVDLSRPPLTSSPAFRSSSFYHHPFRADHRFPPSIRGYICHLRGRRGGQRSPRRIYP